MYKNNVNNEISPILALLCCEAMQQCGPRYKISYDIALLIWFWIRVFKSRRI